MRRNPAALACSLLLALASAAPAAAHEADVIAKIDALAEPFVEAEMAVGFVIGTLHDGETWTKGYGRFDKNRPGAPDADSLFEIGSVSKVFTGLLLADAVERGVAGFDDPIQKHLPPELELPDEDDTIRLWHLTTHTSGLPRMPGNFAPKDPNDPYADYDVARLYATLDGFALPHTPGERSEYSNLGVGLLGHVLVRIDGATSFESLLQERICRPLGMGDTTIAVGKELEPRFAPSYDVDCRLVHHWNFGAFEGAGAIHSTVNDLLKFVRIQIDPGGSPLEDAIDTSHTIRWRAPEGAHSVACGWMVSPLGSHWHNGQVGGHHAFVAFDVKRKVATVLLSNTGCGQLDQLADCVFLSLAGIEKPAPKPKPAVPVERDVMARYAGTYRLNPLSRFTIKLGDDGLEAMLTGQPSLRIYPESKTRFFYRAVDAQIDFEVDADGNPKALVLHQNGADMRAERE